MLDKPLEKPWVEVLFQAVVQCGSALVILKIYIGTVKCEKFRRIESFPAPARQKRCGRL